MTPKQEPYYRSISQWPHTGVILAGGQCRRMKQPKATLLLPSGRTILETMMDGLQQVCQRLMVVGWYGPSPPQWGGDVIYCPDPIPAQGPLSALYTTLSSGVDTRYLVLACDQPKLDVSHLQSLLSHVPEERHGFMKPAGSETFFPFPGHYPATCREGLQRALSQGIRSLKGWLAMEEAPYFHDVPSDVANQLKGINTPEEFQAEFYTLPLGPYGLHPGVCTP